MKRCKGVLLAGMLVLSMSVPVYADKSVVVKVEAPADTTDYYMTCLLYTSDAADEL